LFHRNSFLTDAGADSVMLTGFTVTLVVALDTAVLLSHIVVSN